MKLVVMSDTHGYHKALSPPKGDVFIHCGDHSVLEGTERETRAFLKWVKSLPHSHKIIVPGNHDLWCETVDMKEIAGSYGVHCLVDSSIEVDGITFYGAPWVPQYGNWAYMYPHTEPRYKDLPDNIDILLTHGPPYGHGDWVPDKKLRVGALDLLNEVVRIKPKYHLFGHVHEGREEGRTKSELTPTIFINAACWNHKTKAQYGAITLDI